VESKLRLFREQRKRRDWAKEGEGEQGGRGIYKCIIIGVIG
jgi:hypothetical protein